MADQTRPMTYVTQDGYFFRYPTGRDGDLEVWSPSYGWMLANERARARTSDFTGPKFEWTSCPTTSSRDPHRRDAR